ncbi:hypothetical protein [Haloflavibacter putidus]|uniref:Uncharacterized protein n=1 Tax=Haloflavibacter putidus TaxID=2576776 RepID=A0A507ZS27_9FLAO|nr:hypothetical protein [Haloflavibacter putidus]TQD39341.1 hypothetical protein FKR84_05455 [Haloflavibacter putidus]
MKKYLLYLGLLSCTQLFAQKSLKVVNNTGENINIFLFASGNQPAFGCIGCDNDLESDVFTIEPGTTDYQAFSDVPSGVQYIGVSPCTHNSPCNGVQSDVICGNPQWQMIGFSYPVVVVDVA